MKHRPFIKSWLYGFVLWVMGRVALHRLTTLYRLARWRRWQESERTIRAIEALGTHPASAAAVMMLIELNKREGGSHE